MSSAAAPKFLSERLTCTKQEVRALDPLTKRFVLALAVAGDVVIEEEAPAGRASLEGKASPQRGDA